MNTPFDEQMDRVLEPFDFDHDRLRTELVARLPAETPDTPRATRPNRWREWMERTTMRRRVLRIGIIAAVVAMSFFTFWPSQKNNGITLTAVLQQVRQSHTVAYRTVWQQQGFPDHISHDTVVMSGKFARFEDLVPSDKPAQNGSIVETVRRISVYNAGRILNLDPKLMEAELMDFVTDGLPHKLSSSSTLADLMDLSPANAELLGEQVIEGERLVGFRVNRDYDRFNKRTVVVWADPKTLWPVRVEETTQRSVPDNTPIAARSENETKLSSEEIEEAMAKWPVVTTVRIMTNIVFNVPVDDSLFSLVPPPNYTLRIIKPRE